MSTAVEVGLLGAYVLLIVAIAVQYRRGGISSERLPMLLGMCLVWCSYGLLQLSQGGPIPTGTPLNYAVDGLAVVSLVAGVYGLYRWYRAR